MRASASGIPKELGTAKMVIDISTPPTTIMSTPIGHGTINDVSTVVGAASHLVSHDTNA